MAKGSGGTRASSPKAPKGLTTSSIVDISELYKESGNLDLDRNDVPKVNESDFVNENEYYKMTEPIDIRIDTKTLFKDWEDGLTGGENGTMLYRTKSAIIDAVKAGGGPQLKQSDIEYSDDGYFTAYHPVKKIGDTEKTFWRVDSIIRPTVIRKDKKSGYLSMADRFGHHSYSGHPSFNYKVNVSFRGSEAY